MAKPETDRMFVVRRPRPDEAHRIILNASRNPRVIVICYSNRGDGTVARATYNPFFDRKKNVMSNLYRLFNAVQEADAVIVKENRKGRRRLR